MHGRAGCPTGPGVGRAPGTYSAHAARETNAQRTPEPAILLAEAARTRRQMLAFVVRGARVGDSSLRPRRMPIRRPRVRTKTEPASARARGGGAPGPRRAPREPRADPPPVAARGGAVGARLAPTGAARPPRGIRRRIALRAGAPRSVGERRRPDRSRDAARDARARAPGLLELVPGVARRALELGLSAREPSFHVVRRRRSRGDDRGRHRPLRDPVRHDAAHRAATSSTSTTSTIPRRRFRSPCPRGQVRRSSARSTASSSGSRRRSRRSSRATRSRARRRSSSSEFEAKNRAVIHQLESLAKTLGLRRPVRARGRPDVPDPARQASERRAVRRPRRLDEARAHGVRGKAHARGGQGRAPRSKAERRVRGRARGRVLEGGRGGSSTSAMGELDRAFGDLGADVRHWLQRVHQALVEDWDDLVEMEDEQEQEQRSREERDDPELATRLNRFRVNLLVSHDPDVAGAHRLRHQPDVPEPLRLPREARPLRRPADRLHPHPRGVAPQGERRRARRPRRGPPDRPDHLGAHEARAPRAAHRRRGSARAARPLRDVAPSGAGPAARARRARRVAGALCDAARRRSRLRGALSRQGRGRPAHSAHAAEPGRARRLPDGDGARARVGAFRSRGARAAARSGDAPVGGPREARAHPVAARGDDGLRERAGRGAGDRRCDRDDAGLDEREPSPRGASRRRRPSGPPSRRPR